MATLVEITEGAYGARKNLITPGIRLQMVKDFDGEAIICLSFLELFVKKSENTFGLEQLLNETHVSHGSEVLVLLNCQAEHDGCSLLEVLPEVRILAFCKQVLQNAWIRGSSISWCGSSLTKLVDCVKVVLDTCIKHLIVFAYGRFALH